jgi:hypothetical protein
MFNQTWRWGWALSGDLKNPGGEVAHITEGLRNAFDDVRAWLEFTAAALRPFVWDSKQYRQNETGYQGTAPSKSVSVAIRPLAAPAPKLAV